MLILCMVILLAQVFGGFYKFQSSHDNSASEVIPLFDIEISAQVKGWNAGITEAVENTPKDGITRNRVTDRCDEHVHCQSFYLTDDPPPTPFLWPGKTRRCHVVPVTPSHTGPWDVG